MQQCVQIYISRHFLSRCVTCPKMISPCGFHKGVVFNLISNMKRIIFHHAPNLWCWKTRGMFLSNFNLLRDCRIFCWGQCQNGPLNLPLWSEVASVRWRPMTASSFMSGKMIFCILDIFSYIFLSYDRVLTPPAFVYTVTSASFSLHKVAGREAMGHLAPVNVGIWFTLSQVIILKGWAFICY